jgi:hypothetical protein
MTRPVKAIIDCSTNTAELVELTDEEIAQMEVDVKAYAEVKAKELADAEVKATLKASAKTKLIAGEPLTAEEADTLLV